MRLLGGRGRGRVEIWERPRLQISLFITFTNTSGQIVSFPPRQHIYMEQFEISWSTNVSGWDCANATLLTMKTPPPPLSPHPCFSLCFLSVLSVRCIQIGKRLFQVWLPAIIKPLINEMDQTAALRIFLLHAAISNIQSRVEEWERNHLPEINVI